MTEQQAETATGSAPLALPCHSQPPAARQQPCDTAADGTTSPRAPGPCSAQLGPRASECSPLGQLRPGLSLLLGLCVASLLPGPLRARSCPARSGARLPLPAQHGQQPGPGTGSASLWALQGHRCTFLALSLQAGGMVPGAGSYSL